MSADLLIKNAKIVTPTDTYEGCVYVEGGRIAAITHKAEANAAREIDAAGRHLLPGMVDEHVHMMDPGFTDREDWTTGTEAAARGGITTVIDHHRSDPLVYTREILEDKTAYIDSRSVVDFGQLGGLDVDNLEHLRPMWEGGALGFKGFMCDLHGVPDLSEGVLLNIMREVKSFGGTVMLHCESDSILNKAKEKIDADNRTDYMCISDWRTPESEYVATLDAVALAELTGCKVLVAHVSQPVLLEAIQAARGRGARIYAESCPQYFYLDHSHLAGTRAVRQVHAGHPLRRDARRDARGARARHGGHHRHRPLPLPPPAEGGRPREHPRRALRDTGRGDDGAPDAERRERGRAHAQPDGAHLLRAARARLQHLSPKGVHPAGRGRGLHRRGHGPGGDAARCGHRLQVQVDAVRRLDDEGRARDDARARGGR